MNCSLRMDYIIRQALEHADVSKALLQNTGFLLSRIHSELISFANRKLRKQRDLFLERAMPHAPDNTRCRVQEMCFQFISQCICEDLNLNPCIWI